MNQKTCLVFKLNFIALGVLMIGCGSDETDTETVNLEPTFEVEIDELANEEDKSSMTLSIAPPGFEDGYQLSISLGDSKEPLAADRYMGKVSSLTITCRPFETPSGIQEGIYIVRFEFLDESSSADPSIEIKFDGALGEAIQVAEGDYALGAYCEVGSIGEEKLLMLVEPVEEKDASVPSET